MMEYEDRIKKIEEITFNQIKKISEFDDNYKYDLIKVLKMMNNKGG